MFHKCSFQIRPSCLNIYKLLIWSCNNSNCRFEVCLYAGRQDKNRWMFVFLHRRASSLILLLLPLLNWTCVSFAYVIMWLSDSGSIKTPSTYRGAKEKLWRSHFFPSSRLILEKKKQQQLSTHEHQSLCPSSNVYLLGVAKYIVFLLAYSLKHHKHRG